MTPHLLFAMVVALQAATTTPDRAGLSADVAALASAGTNEGRFDALTAMLRARNLSFTVEPFSLSRPIGREPRTEGRNVVVTLGQGAETLIVGAHYDAARLSDGSLSQGAIDNAASSVILVRLADALRAEALPARIRVVWFDMEELGLIGSDRYVQAHAPERTMGMLNFDVNAYGDTVLYGRSETRENARLRRALVETCAGEDVPCVGFPQMPPGDDRTFVERGIPALSIAILPAIETHQLWLMVNGGEKAGLAATPSVVRTIHTSQDAPDKVSEESMATVLRLAVSLVRRLIRGA